MGEAGRRGLFAAHPETPSPFVGEGGVRGHFHDDSSVTVRIWMIVKAQPAYQYLERGISSFVIISRRAGRPSCVAFMARLIPGMISRGESIRSA